MAPRSAEHPRLRVGLLLRLHEDEGGTISILSIFAVLLLAMLLGMVMNIGRQVNNKVQMQNAADAAAYSGGVVMSRGMNTLAFTNHLLCDVFALTAFMREARDRHTEPLVPEILAAWNQAGQTLAQSEFEKFKKLGPAIQQKTVDEQQMVASYLAWGTASAEAVLPMLEEILNSQLIREYQNAVMLNAPQLAQNAANEAAIRHGGLRDSAFTGSRGPMQAQLLAGSRTAFLLREGAQVTDWTTFWNDAFDPNNWDAYVGMPMLPALDPLMSNEPPQKFFWPEEARTMARDQRRDLAVRYLAMWNAEAMAAFRTQAKMSQFSTLWNGFTCGQLDKLLDENLEKNLPMLIWPGAEGINNRSSSERNSYLENSYMFMAVVYWKPPIAFGPKWFNTPVTGDNVAYAQSMMFIPENRLIRVFLGGGGGSAPQGTPIGGVPGDFVELPPAGDPQTPVPPADGGGQGEWVVVRESRPTQWDLLNQSWRTQLVPATHPSLASALRWQPQLGNSQQPAQEVALPDFSDLTPEDLSVLNHH